MAWTPYQKLLTLVMVVTGSINSLTTKWADKLEATNSIGDIAPFNHPFLQSAAMFFGEAVCLAVFKLVAWKTRNTGGHSITEGNQQFNPFILLPAAMFDLIGTSTMYIGLTLTFVSSFQMLRGSIIVFVAVLSRIFLQRILQKRQFIGIVLVIIGLVVVGAADYEAAGESKGKNSIITGDLLIITAQVISAFQMVYEEKYVAGLNIPPLQAVGWEGVFGVSVLSGLMVVFYWIPAPPGFGNNPRGVVEDAIDGFVQMGNNPVLVIAILGTIISIAFFNFAGISVTKEMSATTRMVLDSIRTFVVWMVSLMLKWQGFHWEQMIGFAILLLGMCEYNRMLSMPRFLKRRNSIITTSISSSTNETPDIDDAPENDDDDTAAISDGNLIDYDTPDDDDNEVAGFNAEEPPMPNGRIPNMV